MTGPIDLTRSAKQISPLPQEETIQKQTQASKSVVEDRVSIGEQEKTTETYGPGLKVASPYELLRNLVIKTLQEQGLELQFADGNNEINFETMTTEEAQALVADDGYFGVDKTSQRIVDFAISGFGNDPSRLQEMKDAIDKGFMDAQSAFGGALPEISQQTYDAIMEKLDAFANPE